MEKYECDVCGYVYDPELGDEAAGISAGTEFSALPADWRCPICNERKNEFRKPGEEYFE